MSEEDTNNPGYRNIDGAIPRMNLNIPVPEIKSSDYQNTKIIAELKDVEFPDDEIIRPAHSIDIDFNFSRKESIISRLLPPYGSNSIFGISTYGKYSKKWWFKWFFESYHHYILTNIENIYYWIKDRTITRHHIVHTGREPGYCDVDELIFRACFALLGRFVEEELGRISVDDALEDGHYMGYRIHSLEGTDEVAIDLWLWYIQDLKNLENEEMNDYRGFNKKYGFDYIENVKDKKLRELIDIRGHLWT